MDETDDVGRFGVEDLQECGFPSKKHCYNIYTHKDNLNKATKDLMFDVVISCCLLGPDEKGGREDEEDKDGLKHVFRGRGPVSYHRVRLYSNCTHTLPLHYS